MEETTNQYPAFHGIRGNRGAGSYEEGKREQVTPERPRGVGANAAQGKKPYNMTTAANAQIIQVKQPTLQMIILAKKLEEMNPGE